MTSSPERLLQRLNEKADTDAGVLLSRFGREPSQDDINAIIRICTSFSHYVHRPALQRFVDEADVTNATGVFWDVYQWSKDTTGSFPPDPSIEAEIYDGMILEVLDRLYETSKVSYQADVDDSENCERLFIHLHIASARAFRIRKGPELSEEALDCFREVSRTYERVRWIRGWNRYVYESGIQPSALVSTLAVAAMNSLELSRFHRREPDGFEEALKCLWQAITLYEDALWNILLLRESREIGSDHSEEEIERQDRLEKLLTGLEVSLSEAAGLYHTLQANPETVSDWVEVARICESMAQLYTPGVIAEYDELTWIEFWSYARGLSQRQLSHSNYWKLREDDGSHAAESRLNKYFHGRASWESLPERSRRRLVNADTLFHSTQRGAPEAILNDLLIAVEEMFSAYFWLPLSAAEWEPELYDFEERRDYLGGKVRNPGLWDFIWVCKQPFFGRYLESRKVGEQEAHFLTEELPARMNELREARNRAQHEIGHTMSRDDVEWYFRAFIGIDQPGVLPTFARIGRKLQRN